MSLRRPTVLAALFVIAFAVPTFAQEAERRITQVAGDVYWFQNVSHRSIFVVTSEGIAATDPISAEDAAWLKAEMTERFGQPVRWLIYSHHHADHISGGEVFADTATVVAHERTKSGIEREGVATAPPDLTFSHSMTLDLGGKSLELTYVGEGHSDSMIVAVIRPENVGFVVDIAARQRLPFRDMRGDIDGWIEQIRRAEALDFEIMAPGHGPLGTKADLTEARTYIEELRTAVLAEIEAGRNDDEIATSVTMEAYADWAQYDAWRELNVRGMARYLRETGHGG